MKEIVLAWGVSGVVGVVGLYLILGGIVGRLVPIPPLMRENVALVTVAQRCVLAAFGAILAFPLLLSTYKNFALDVRSVIVAPAVEETVAVPVVKVAFGTGADCRTIETFGLKERASRRLKYAEFDGALLVSVGRIDAKGCEISLVIGGETSRIIAYKPGESWGFKWRGRAYQLVLRNIYHAWLGANSVALEICQW